MNKNMTYQQWERALAGPAKKVSEWFEETLYDHFTAWAEEHSGLVGRNPMLSNGSRPDFRIEDREGLAYYIEAKALFGPTGKSDYFKWRIDLSDLQHPKSGGLARCQVNGKMTQDLSENEKDSIRRWIQELDPESEPPRYQPYYQEEFPCGGTSCEIQVNFLSEEKTMVWDNFHFGPHWRSRIEEKVNEVLKDPKTGHEKYTRETLEGTPLVIAVLDVSGESMIDLKGELYGNQFLNIDAGGKVTDGGLTGIGIWRDENGIRNDRAHIGGIWYWYNRATISEDRGRPILATNPDDASQKFPSCLQAFRYIEWRPGQPNRARPEEMDGGQSFNEESLKNTVNNYTDECRRGLSIA